MYYNRKVLAIVGNLNTVYDTKDIAFYFDCLL